MSDPIPRSYLGKMLVYGAMLGCLDPVLTVAASLAHGRPVFLSCPPDQQADLERTRAALLGPAVAARSDHVALVAAFNGWAKARSKGGAIQCVPLINIIISWISSPYGLSHYNLYISFSFLYCVKVAVLLVLITVKGISSQSPHWRRSSLGSLSMQAHWQILGSSPETMPRRCLGEARAVGSTGRRSRPGYHGP